MSDHSRPVTGYPAYPPQPQSTYFHVTPNPYYAPRPRATFVHRFFAFLIGCILLTGVFIFIIWLILRPQIPQFIIQTLTLTHFNLSSTSLISGNWDVSFVARNPNSKITLYYDEIGAAVYYKSDSISETTVPPFVQGTRNESALKAVFASVNAYVEGRDGINEERGRGTVGFNLRMVTRVRFQAGSWWARRRILRVIVRMKKGLPDWICGEQKLRFLSSAAYLNNVSYSLLRNCRQIMTMVNVVILQK